MGIKVRTRPSWPAAATAAELLLLPSTAAVTTEPGDGPGQHPWAERHTQLCAVAHTQTFLPLAWPTHLLTLRRVLLRAQLNMSNPSTGGQKLIEIDDDKRLRSLYEKRLAAEVEGDDIGDEFKGYIFKITGGQDKQGFSMKQGILTADRVKIMMAKGTRLPQATLPCSIWPTSGSGSGSSGSSSRQGRPTRLPAPGAALAAPAATTGQTRAYTRTFVASASPH